MFGSEEPIRIFDEQRELGEKAALQHFSQSATLVITILVVNLIVFLLLTLSGGSTDPQNLIRFGALFQPLVKEGQYWRLLTAAFLHIGIVHLLLNSYSLWVLGSLLERLYGTAQFACLYLVSALTGSLLSVSLTEGVAAGASGAIFGVAGAMAVGGLRYQAQIPASLKDTFGKGALPFIGYNLFYGFTNPGIDNFAHLGGAAGGALCALLMRPRQDRPSTVRIIAAGFVALVLLLVGIQFRTASIDQAYERDVMRAAGLLDAHDLKGADAAIQMLAKRGQRDWRFRYLLGGLRVQQGKLEEAVAELRQATRIDPKSAIAHNGLAKALFEKGDLDGGISELHQALRLEPKLPETHFLLCAAFVDKSEPDKAIAECREAINLKPDFAEAHSVVAAALLEKGNVDGAISECREALKLQPNNAMHHQHLGLALARKGDLDGAIAEYREALKLKPDMAQANLGLALLLELRTGAKKREK